MTERNTFDPEILKRAWQERLKYFDSYKVSHRNLEYVTAETKSAIKRQAGKGFLFMIGPAGIGKSTALQKIVNSLLKESMAEMEENPGLIPYAQFESQAEGKFDWKEHWLDCLVAIKEPLIKYKTAHGEPDVERGNYGRLSAKEQSKAILRRAFENGAQHRGLICLFMDEAHHLTYVPSAKLLRPQLEIIKSVASRSGAKHALFGTYDLLKLRNASAQLGRRTKTIHFSRYRPDSEEDMVAFADVTLSLLNHMPLPEPPDFRSETDLEYFFDKSLGCVGWLKDWFSAALGEVLEEGKKKLTRSVLEKNEHPVDVLEKNSIEIIKGERLLEQDEAKIDTIRLRMLHGSKFKEGTIYPEGVGSNTNNKDTSEEVDSVNGETSVPNRPRQSTKKGKKIERLPKRDKTGGGRKKRAA